MGAPHGISILQPTLTNFSHNTKSSVLHGFKLDASVAAVNLQFIHQDGYALYEVKEGDDIELLTAVVGG